MSARTQPARNRHDRVVARQPAGPIDARRDGASATEVREVPPVKEQLAHLEENVAELTDAVDTVTKILDPVLRPIPAEKEVLANMIGDPVVGEVAARVRHASRNVIGLATRLRDLVDRVEV